MTRRKVTPDSDPLRDLDDPTAGFPIGLLTKNRNAAKKARKKPATVDEWLDDVEAIPDHDDDYDDYEDVPAPTNRITVDARFVALWLAAAGVLGLLALLAVAAAILF